MTAASIQKNKSAQNAAEIVRAADFSNGIHSGGGSVGAAVHRANAAGTVKRKRGQHCYESPIGVHVYRRLVCTYCKLSKAQITAENERRLKAVAARELNECRRVIEARTALADLVGA